MARRWLLLICLLLSLPLRAEVTVLLHGYLGSADSWEWSGVDARLRQSGWQDGGVAVATPTGVWLPSAGKKTERSFYRLQLPSTAPLMLQVDIARAMLEAITARHPDEPVNLVGHSAGGVVARALLVRYRPPQVATLVAIAAPNLGTGRALQALDRTDLPWPFSWAQDFATDGLSQVVRHSRGLLWDLRPAASGSTLFWLNGQPHPEIRYVALVRPGPVGLGDELVPVYSQSLQGVGGITEPVETRVVATGHALTPLDAQVLVEVLGAK